MSAITVTDVRKRYGDFEAVRGVTFDVEYGEVFCLLGPNGAGKTTITEILEGHRLPTSGSASVLGFDPGKGERGLRDRIGVVLQSAGVPDELTVGELLEMFAGWYANPRPIDEVIELVELVGKRGERAVNLSGGQRRRLDLALGLIGDPDLIFLDEPTTGFDPHARRQAWSTIRSLCSMGKTVFLTTHFMDEAQSLANRICVMVGGQIVASGTPEDIGGRDALPTEIRFTLPDGMAIADLPLIAVPDAKVIEQDECLLITTSDALVGAHALTGWALERRCALSNFSVSQPSLEDVYLSLTTADDGDGVVS
jgi:ABC-2 type transport system ATP-binding protein